jgi:hypothetical protein
MALRTRVEKLEHGHQGSFRYEDHFGICEWCGLPRALSALILAACDAWDGNRCDCKPPSFVALQAFYSRVDDGVLDGVTHPIRGWMLSPELAERLMAIGSGYARTI